jgi:thiamine kinase-like enzyme
MSRYAYALHDPGTSAQDVGKACTASLDPKKQDSIAWSLPFQWLAAEHPFQSVIESLKRTVEADQGIADWETASPLSAPGLPDKPRRAPQVQAEFKAVPCPQSASGWQIERVYWSLQDRDHTAPLGFRARTLVWHRKAPMASGAIATGGPQAPKGWAVSEGQASWHELPDDPRLPQLGPWVQAYCPAASAPGGTLTALRYVPLRRLTFLRRESDGAVIGKFRRKSRHAEAQRLLQPIAEAVDRCRPGFSVARPGPVEPESALYFQSQLPGEDLAQVVAPRVRSVQVDLTTRALGEVGRLTAALHRLPLHPDQVARRDSIAAQLDNATLQLHLLEFVQPEFRPEWHALGRALTRRPQELSDDSIRFCHGDLVCSQWLIDRREDATGPQAPAALPPGSTRWALTDFDLCRLGDPCRDVAHLIASLDDDLPALHELAGSQPAECQVQHRLWSQAFLEAYQEACGEALAPDRLAWQQVCAEIHQLWLMLTKDRFRPLAFMLRLERAIGHLETLDRSCHLRPRVNSAATMP